MSKEKSTSKYWLYFAISTIVLICMLIWVRSFFWLALPFVVTFFAKSLNLIDDNQPQDQEIY